MSEGTRVRVILRGRPLFGWIDEVIGEYAWVEWDSVPYDERQGLPAFLRVEDLTVVE